MKKWPPTGTSKRYLDRFQEQPPCKQLLGNQYDANCNPVLTARKHSDGSLHAYIRCDTCGGICATQVKLPDGSKTSDLPLRWDEFEKQWAEFEKSKPKDTAIDRMCPMPLCEYHNSVEWKRRREQVLERDRHKCRLCGGTATCVHHKTYHNCDGSGKEPDCDLVSLCDNCHEAIHDWNPWEHHIKTHGWTNKNMFPLFWQRSQIERIRRKRSSQTG